MSAAKAYRLAWAMEGGVGRRLRDVRGGTSTRQPRRSASWVRSLYSMACAWSSLIGSIAVHLPIVVPFPARSFRTWSQLAPGGCTAHRGFDGGCYGDSRWGRAIVGSVFIADYGGGWSDQAAPNGYSGGLGTGVDTQLGEEIRNMGLDGARPDEE
jgi:hypothetical protein